MIRRSARIKGDRLLLVKGWKGKRLERSTKKVCETLREARMSVGEGTSVSDVFNVFKEVAEVVGKWGVDGVNENGEQLVNICADKGLFLANTFFQHRLIHRYTWRKRDERGEQKSMIDYIAVDERIKKRMCWMQEW